MQYPYCLKLYFYINRCRCYVIKFGNTEFDNLIILWYNKKEEIFEEMPTTRNKTQSTISTKTTHFSQYMIVYSEKMKNTVHGWLFLLTL